MKSEPNITESKQALQAEISRRRDAATALDRQRTAVKRELQRLEAKLAAIDQRWADAPSDLINAGAPIPATPADKVALFRFLFRGRHDVYPRVWTNARSGRTG